MTGLRPNRLENKRPDKSKCEIKALGTYRSDLVKFAADILQQLRQGTFPLVKFQLFLVQNLLSNLKGIEGMITRFKDISINGETDNSYSRHTDRLHAATMP